MHILKLLDDDSPKVRERVWQALEENLPRWEGFLHARLEELPTVQRNRLRDLLAARTREGFRAAWAEWRSLPGENARLEGALAGLSLYLSGGLAAGGAAQGGRLAGLLDGLAAEFRAAGNPIRPTALAAFLFQDKGLKGADADYYDPRNSDLVHVIGQGRGIPISLACVFILVGGRLGLEISGCDVPEHFLTRSTEDGAEVIIDCYDEGKALGPDRLAQLERKYAPDFSKRLRAQATAEDMVARILRNLINAFHLSGDKQGSDFMWSLAEDLRGEKRDDFGEMS